MIKSGLLAAELLTSYFGETEAAYSWLVANLAIARGNISATGKRRHTIGSRDFVLVRLGEVNHDGPEVSG